MHHAIVQAVGTGQAFLLESKSCDHVMKLQEQQRAYRMIAAKCSIVRQVRCWCGVSIRPRCASSKFGVRSPSDKIIDAKQNGAKRVLPPRLLGFLNLLIAAAASHRHPRPHRQPVRIPPARTHTRQILRTEPATETILHRPHTNLWR